MPKFSFNHHIAHDCNLAYLYFDDFKEGRMNDNVNLFFGSRSTDYLVIFENEKVANASYYKKSKLSRMKKANLYELLEKNNHNIIYTCNVEDMTKSDMIDCLLEIDNQEYYTKHYEKEYYQDFDFGVRGYRQGDFVKVKIVGNVEKWIDEEYLTNIFYDTPISGFVEVFNENGGLIDDFQLYDLKNFNEYAYYNKDELIAMIGDYCSNKDYKDLLIAYLNENLNNDLEYNY